MRARPGQAQVAYTYDAADRLTGITEGAASVAHGYDAAGRRQSTTLPNGIVESYAYDIASRLTGITYSRGGSTLGGLSYEYDKQGRRTAVWGSYARTGLPQPMASAAYDAANRRITQDGTTLTYDANGNLIGDSGGTYSWNARDELASLARGTTASASFVYDPLGRRQSKTISGTKTDFVYDRLNVVQERRGGAPYANLLTGGLDEVFTRSTAGETSNYLTDALGSTIALADPLGWVGSSYSYDPFGNTTARGAASDNTHQYTGGENDGTGLYYYRARYYSPAMQRFISEDPIGLAGGDTNVYAYVGNSPLNYVDPSGLVDLTPNFVDDAVGWGADRAEDAFDWGTDQAQQSMEFYADWANSCGSAFACAVASTGRELTSLATRKNIGGTALALIPGPGWGLKGLQGVRGLTELTFGHGARHLVGTGLGREAVEAAVERQIRRSIRPGAGVGGDFMGRVTVNGKLIQYRAHGLANGRIHVGTYHPVG